MRAKKGFRHELWANKTLFLMLTPTVLFFIVFSYFPMVGIYYAFTNYTIRGGLFGSEFVGFNNFQFLFSSGTIWNITKNTILYNLAFIFIGSLLQIVCAIFLSEVRSKLFKKTAQSIMFLPYFISMVLVGVFVYNLFNIDTGFANSLLRSFGLPEYDFYLEPSVWKYIIVAANVWKGVGYGAIIYLAAILSISEEYYEAAKLDGANKFQQVRHITLPFLVPTFIILTLFSLGGILKGQFDLFYQIIGNNGVLFDATDIIDTYVYRSLTANFNVGMGTAAGLYQSVFGLILVLSANAIVRKFNKDYSLF